MLTRYLKIHQEVQEVSSQPPHSYPHNLVKVDATVLPALLDEIARCLPRWKETGHPVIIAATSVDTEGLPQALVSCFKHVLKFGVCLAFLFIIHLITK